MAAHIHGAHQPAACTQACNTAADAPGYVQHDARGNPVVNTTRFPNLSGLVAAGHSKNLKMGWYLNGCKCGEGKSITHHNTM